jgi:methylaspartate mutase epsilon subunit
MTSALNGYVERQHTMVTQARFGSSSPTKMRAGLAAMRGLHGPVVGTLTVDSFTRQGRYDRVRAAGAAGQELNGYPIVTVPAAETCALLAGLAGPDFPVQVRHGAALPADIVRASAAAGIFATEGGPVSYPIVYGRTPLNAAVAAWAQACEAFALAGAAAGCAPHVESFAGCLLGQLCPPSLLNAISILEGLFFERHGIVDVSLSCAQGTNADQDVGSLFALADLAQHYLPSLRPHVVFYHFMGLFPETPSGARALTAVGTKSAATGGAKRIIVKTNAEAHRIPTLDDNLEALRWAQLCAAGARGATPMPAAQRWRGEIAQESRALVDAVLSLNGGLDAAIPAAFARGLLDIPYCLHPDNRNRARARVDPATGSIVWAHPGRLPLPHGTVVNPCAGVSAAQLLEDITFNRRLYDETYDDGDRRSSDRHAHLESRLS